MTRALTLASSPSSAGESRLLQLAASLAGQAPVVLGDAVTGLGERNIQVVVRAVLPASGRRQVPSA